jgi:hypothetical protein
MVAPILKIINNIIVKISIQYLVDPFSLSIGLWMENNIKI